MAQKGERTWIPLADCLLILAVIFSLFLVILPLILTSHSSLFIGKLARAGCSASTVVLGGYIPSILAHYRLIFGNKRKGPRVNPEPAEKAWIVITILSAIVIFVVVLIGF